MCEMCRPDTYAFVLKLVQKLWYLTLNHGLSSEVLTQLLILSNQLWNKNRSYTSPCSSIDASLWFLHDVFIRCALTAANHRCTWWYVVNTLVFFLWLVLKFDHSFQFGFNLISLWLLHPVSFPLCTIINSVPSNYPYPCVMWETGRKNVPALEGLSPLHHASICSQLI